MKIIEIIQAKIDKQLIDKLIKFLFVGGFSTIINYACFYALFEYFSVQYLIASIIGYITGIFISYFLNKKWTYKVAKESENTFIYRYIFVFLTSLAASTLTLKILVDVLGIYPLIANVLAIGQSTVTNFLGTTFFVFKDKEEKVQQQ